MFFLANKDNLMLDFFLGDIPIIQDEKKQHFDKTSSNETGQVAHIFNTIDANLNSELVNKTNAIYQFNVKGKIFIYLLRFKYYDISKN